VVLVAPRGYCAGVERAVEAVEAALAQRGAPVYVRKQIVHNVHVLRELESRGAIFVESEDEVPPARTLGLTPVDATCPLVAKVHAEARHFAARGYGIILIGHDGHEEVEGTMGEAPQAILLVESVEDAELVSPPQTERLAYLTQTTLSVDDTAAIVGVLRRRFPGIEAPSREDICYATTNRQRAVKAVLPEIDLLLVIGSRNSSNSNRLVEVARSNGVAAELIDDESEIDESWLVGVDCVGVTSGESAPEYLVRRVVEWFARRGFEEIHARPDLVEDVSFRLPVEVR
jgi:4-hydroxy-3-methylbut-2-enyl diphosphate reductase